MSPRAARVARGAFGVWPVFFGLAHLTGIGAVAPMVPNWMPLGGAFWAGFTGIAFVLSGLGILSGVLDVLAARLLAVMLLVFGVVALAPLIVAAPRERVLWGADAARRSRRDSVPAAIPTLSIPPVLVRRTVEDAGRAAPLSHRAAGVRPPRGVTPASRRPESETMRACDSLLYGSLENHAVAPRFLCAAAVRGV